MKSQMRLRAPIIVATVLINFGCGGSDGTTSAVITGVLTGHFEQVTESRGIFIWGDSVNYLCQQWSIAQFDQSGWFYGTSFPWSSADVFVLAAPSDPLAVIAAESFDYTTDSVHAREGDTVFFRGRNGFFGALTITSVDGGMGALLTGEWFFKAGGGGDFTDHLSGDGVSNYDAGNDGCEGF